MIVPQHDISRQVKTYFYIRSRKKNLTKLSLNLADSRKFSILLECSDLIVRFGVTEKLLIAAFRICTPESYHFLIFGNINFKSP